MNEKDKQLEDFFKKSMEEFHDSPSDSVWDQLSDQLEAEETFFTKMWKQVRPILPLGLLLLCFGAISIYSYGTIKDLQSINNLLQTSNLSLNDKISTLTNENQDLVMANKSLQTDLKIKTKEFEKVQLQILESKESINNSISSHATIKKKLQLSEALNITYQAQLEACANDLSALSSLNAQGTGIGSREGNTMEDDGRIGVVASSDVGLGLSNDRLENLVLSKIEPLTFSSGLKIEDLGDGSPNERWKPGEFVKNPKGNQEEKLAISKSIQYRYGFTGRAYNTFVKGGNTLNFSTSYGLKHEIVFKEKWGLTHSLEYNDQEYTIEEVAGVLPRSVLDRFPGSPGDYANVRSVKSRSKYFDTQVGVKYQMQSKKRKASYFINPSVVWQFYLPQEFNYNLIQAQDLLIERREYVAYLGSVNLQVGMERSLNDNMDFQLALFAEKSLIDLGFDDQDLTLVGLRTSILFGK